MIWLFIYFEVELIPLPLTITWCLLCYFETPLFQTYFHVPWDFKIAGFNCTLLYLSFSWDKIAKTIKRCMSWRDGVSVAFVCFPAWPGICKQWKTPELPKWGHCVWCILCTYWGHLHWPGIHYPKTCSRTALILNQWLFRCFKLSWLFFFSFDRLVLACFEYTDKEET